MNSWSTGGIYERKMPGSIFIETTSVVWFASNHLLSKIILKLVVCLKPNVISGLLKVFVLSLFLDQKFCVLVFSKMSYSFKSIKIL